MRKKLGTSLDETLVERARAAARSEGKTLADFLEDALRAHLARRHWGRSPIDAVEGIFELDPAILGASLYDD